MSQNKKETAQKFARLFDGRAYGNELTIDEARELYDSNCVAIFGASDDLIELRGALDDELGAYGGLEFYIVKDQRTDEYGVIDAYEFDNDKNEQFLICCRVSVKFGDKFTTHDWEITDNSQQSATFEILEDGSNYCQGLVIAL